MIDEFRARTANPRLNLAVIEDDGMITRLVPQILDVDPAVVIDVDPSAST